MQTNSLGRSGLQVTPICLGTMTFGEQVTGADAHQILDRAMALGINFIDTAEMYAVPPRRETFGATETILGDWFASRPGARQRVVLATKAAGPSRNMGWVHSGSADLTPAQIVNACDGSLRRLQTDVIDVYYLHRWHKAVPIEESVGAMARLVQEGKVRALGLSEVGATTLRRAHAEHPIAAVQTEYSLWTRNAEIAVLDACRDIGAAFVAFSPLARGVLTSAPPDVATLGAKDIRRGMPRFAPEHWPTNLAVHAAAMALAQEAGAKLAQMALAWLLSRGEHVLAIPGTTRAAHLRENLAAADLAVAPAWLARLDALVNPCTVAGDRYSAQASLEVDTETA